MLMLSFLYRLCVFAVSFHRCKTSHGARKETVRVLLCLVVLRSWWLVKSTFAHRCSLATGDVWNEKDRSTTKGVHEILAVCLTAAAAAFAASVYHCLPPLHTAAAAVMHVNQSPGCLDTRHRPYAGDPAGRD